MMKKSDLIKIIKEEITSLLSEETIDPENGVYTVVGPNGIMHLVIPDQQDIKQAFRDMFGTNVQKIKDIAAKRGYIEIEAPKLGTLVKKTGQAMVYGKYKKGAQ